MKPADPIRQRQAMTRRLERRIACEGKLTFPAVPSMVEDYTSRCERVFTAMGRSFNPEERAHLHKTLLDKLNAAFRHSQRSQITVTYHAQLGGALHYVVAHQHASLAQTYEGWVQTRQPPFFGTEPDAKVMDMARQLGPPGQCRVLDIGAGTGRNALALARRGHPVDAVELTAQFAQMLRETAQADGLPVQVIGEDVFQAKGRLSGPYRLMFLSEVVSDFRSPAQVREVFELASQCLAPDGVLLLNTFVARPHYSADDAAREFSQQVYSYFLTQDELTAACRGLPLELVSDEGVQDYEKTHLPASAWPPTTWYPQWVAGGDAFDLPEDDSPISMRWLAYRHSGRPDA